MQSGKSCWINDTFSLGCKPCGRLGYKCTDISEGSIGLIDMALPDYVIGYESTIGTVVGAFPGKASHLPTIK